MTEQVDQETVDRLSAHIHKSSEFRQMMDEAFERFLRTGSFVVRVGRFEEYGND